MNGTVAKRCADAPTVPAITLLREAKRVLKPWLKPVTGRRATPAPAGEDKPAQRHST